MFTPEQYYLGWACYILAGMLIFAVVWRISKNFWPYAKHIVLLSTLIILFTPALVPNDSERLAPAWFMASFEVLLARFDFFAFWRAGTVLLYAWMIALLIYHVALLIKMLLPNNRTKQASKTKSKKASRQHHQSAQAMGDESDHTPNYDLADNAKKIVPSVSAAEAIDHSSDVNNAPFLTEYSEDDSSALIRDKPTFSNDKSIKDEPLILSPKKKDQDALTDEEYQKDLETMLEFSTDLVLDPDATLINDKKVEDQDVTRKP